MSEMELDQPQPQPNGWSCTISTHIRALGKVLTAFDKIGRDLFIEAAPDRLLLRTLNQAQSAYCLCTLPVALFDHYEMGDDPPNVKIYLKLLSPLFRSHNVESTTLHLMHHGTSSYVRVVLRCASRLTKTFDLSYEEVVPMTAMYDTAACPHRICVEPRLLLDCVNNLQGDSEVMLALTHSELVVKNDVDENRAEDAVRTEMNIAPDDLHVHEFAIGPLACSPLRLSFGTKEFKAVLSFAEACSSRLTMHFDFGGRPIILVADAMDGPPSARARLECVIATVVDQSAVTDEIFADAFGQFDAGAPEHEQPPALHEQALRPDRLARTQQPDFEQPLEPCGATFPPTVGGLAVGGRAQLPPAAFGAARAGARPQSPGAARDQAFDVVQPSGDTVDSITPQPQPPPRALAQGEARGDADGISSFPPSSRAPTAGLAMAVAVMSGGHANGAMVAVQAALLLADSNPPRVGASAGGGFGAFPEQQLQEEEGDTDNDEVGATPPSGSPLSKRQCAGVPGFVEQFGMPTPCPGTRAAS